MSKSGGPSIPQADAGRLADAIDGLGKWMLKELEDLQGPNVLSGVLYHYTDASAMRSILSEGKLRFTDFRHLNDPQELTYGLKTARYAIDVRLSTDTGKLQAQFLQRLERALADDVLQNDNDPDKNDFFVACFSRNGDELGQWRAYGADGRGFAIGFRAASAFAPADPAEPFDLSLDQATVAVLVTYDEASAAELAQQRKVDAALDFLHRAEPVLSSYPDAVDWFLARLVEETLWGLVATSIGIKHRAYRHEQEVRFVILGQHLRLFPAIQIRDRAGELVPYIERRLAIKQNLIEIVTGPASHPDSERTVGTLLDVCRVDPKPDVRVSEIPYRSSR